MLLKYPFLAFFLLFSGITTAQQSLTAQLDAAGFVEGYRFQFEFNRAKMKPADTLVLHELCVYINSHPEDTLEVTYFDINLTPEYSLILSTDRGWTVNKFLATRIDKERYKFHYIILRNVTPNSHSFNFRLIRP